MGTTFTLLVTIAHDDGAAPSTDLLEAIVQRGLEEGVREFAGVQAATVSVFDGDCSDAKKLPRDGLNLRRLHRELCAA